MRLNDLKTQELNSTEYKECIGIAKNIRRSPETEQALIKMALKLWRGSANYHIGDYEMISMIKSGLENNAFTFNYVYKRSSDNSKSSLEYRVIPLMLKAGMLSKDESGRYVRYTITETGFNWLINSLFTDCRCKLSAECVHCEGGKNENTHKNRNQKCWGCNGDKICTDCRDRFECFGYDGFMNLIQTYNFNS